MNLFALSAGQTNEMKFEKLLINRSEKYLCRADFFEGTPRQCWEEKFLPSLNGSHSLRSVNSDIFDTYD